MPRSSPTLVTLLLLLIGACGPDPKPDPSARAAGTAGTNGVAAATPAGSGTLATPCQSDGQCSGGLICGKGGLLTGVCTSLCESDAACQVLHGDGARCHKGVCALGCQGGLMSDDCPAGTRCTGTDLCVSEQEEPGSLQECTLSVFDDDTCDDLCAEAGMRCTHTCQLSAFPSEPAAAVIYSQWTADAFAVECFGAPVGVLFQCSLPVNGSGLPSGAPPSTNPADADLQEVRTVRCCCL